MTTTVEHFHFMLQSAHGREDLVSAWKVFRAVAKNFEGADWQPIEEAFKLRAEEIGLTWGKTQ